MPVVNVAAYLFIFLLPHFMLSEWRTGIVSHEPASVDASNLRPASAFSVASASKSPTPQAKAIGTSWLRLSNAEACGPGAGGKNPERGETTHPPTTRRGGAR